MTFRPMASSSPVVTPGRTAARMRSCISATTRPALRILAISGRVRTTGVLTILISAGPPLRKPGHRNRPQTTAQMPGFPTAGSRAGEVGVDGGDQAGRDVVGAPEPVDRLEQAAVAEH